jgi:Arc/MetJ-type ribon-helix-helix transcriptional regulator
MVQLTDDLVRELDAAATARGLSRSALIREAVEAFLANDREAAIDRAIVEGYTRIPPGTPDEWGDLEALSDHAARETLARLDREEREAGFDPW